MDFFKVVRQRRSIRAFKEKPVEEGKLRKILEAIRNAPSAGNLQSYEVYLVRDRRLRERLVAAAAGQEFVGQAAAVLVFCSHGERAAERYGERGVNLYSIQDATIGCTHAMLAATALGLGSVWVGKFDEAAVSAVAKVPEGQRPIAMLPIGYPAESPSAPARREIAHLIREVDAD